MKFVLVCNHVQHWRYCINLGAELVVAGHEANVVSHGAIGAVHDADVVIAINRERTERIPRDAVHISWVQDYRIGVAPPYDERCLPRDIIYTYGEGPIIGVPCQQWKNYRGSLLTAAETRLLAYPFVPQDVDLSIAGYMHHPVLTWPTVNKEHLLSEEHSKCISKVLRTSYVPLLGNLDQQKMLSVVLMALEEAHPDIWDILVEHYAGTIVHEYSRSIDRLMVGRLMLSVSTNIEFRGENWGAWPEFSPYSKPFYGVNDREEMLRFYQRSRINVHNNVFGFALHDRVLEAMAVGGFVMSNASPYYGKAGQMTESFVPDVHYGEYKAETFRDSAL